MMFIKWTDTWKNISRDTAGRAYSNDGTNAADYVWNEGLFNLADGKVTAEGHEVVVDPDLSDDEEGGRCGLPLLCDHETVVKNM